LNLHVAAASRSCRNHNFVRTNPLLLINDSSDISSGLALPRRSVGAPCRRELAPPRSSWTSLRSPSRLRINIFKFNCGFGFGQLFDQLRVQAPLFVYTPFKSSVHTNFSPQITAKIAGHSLTAAIVSKSPTSSVTTSPPRNAGPSGIPFPASSGTAAATSPRNQKIDFLALFDTKLEKEE